LIQSGHIDWSHQCYLEFTLVLLAMQSFREFYGARDYYTINWE